MWKWDLFFLLFREGLVEFEVWVGSSSGVRLGVVVCVSMTQLTSANMKPGHKDMCGEEGVSEGVVRARVCMCVSCTTDRCVKWRAVQQSIDNCGFVFEKKNSALQTSKHTVPKKQRFMMHEHTP